MAAFVLRLVVGGGVAHVALPEAGTDGLVVVALAPQVAARVDVERQLGQRPRGGAELGHGAVAHVEHRLVARADQQLSCCS